MSHFFASFSSLGEIEGGGKGEEGGKVGGRREGGRGRRGRREGGRGRRGRREGGKGRRWRREGGKGRRGNYKDHYLCFAENKLIDS